MKKKFTSTTWKRYQKRKNLKTFLRRSRIKRREHKSNFEREKRHLEERKKVESYSLHLASKRRSKILRAKNPNKYKNHSAPNEFSLVSNPEILIEYFNEAERILNEKRQIIFDISKIHTLTPDGITLLIAKINHESFHKGIKILGNSPDDLELKDLFIQSGFYTYVDEKSPRPNNNTNLLLHKETNNKVEPTIAKDACLLGIKHTFNNEEIYEPLYNILIEAMQNTNNHASILKKGYYDWWLYVYNDPKSKITSYSFLDLGVGIFESLPVRNWKESVKKFLQLNSNLDLVDKLFSGDISSRTGKAERGKGMPQIYQCAQDKNIKEFIIISNDVYANLKTNQHRKLNTKFAGTMLYWEIIP